jgi:hypothetical protein
MSGEQLAHAPHDGFCSASVQVGAVAAEFGRARNAQATVIAENTSLYRRPSTFAGRGFVDDWQRDRVTLGG